MIKYYLKKIWIAICYLFPLRKKVIFCNFNGRGMGDDPKYIALYLLNNRPDIKIIWCLSDITNELPKGVYPVKYGSWGFYYHQLTAKVRINNIKHGIFVPKRKDQFYIQTWHATFGLKKIEQDAENLSDTYIKNAKRDAAQTDLMYSNNDYRCLLYIRSFWYNGPVIKCDVPRVSILLNPPHYLREHVYKSLNIPNDKHIILYAPTFRKDHNLTSYIYNFNAIINAANKRFKKDYIVLYRLHPNIAYMNDEIKLSNGHIIMASDYPDMQELLALADILITDFSASMFDFGILKKPVFLFAKDYDNYINSDRSLNLPIESLPFSMSKTEEELCRNILNFNNHSYQEEVNLFYKKIGLIDHGHGDEVLANIVASMINGSFVSELTNYQIFSND